MGPTAKPTPTNAWQRIARRAWMLHVPALAHAQARPRNQLATSQHYLATASVTMKIITRFVATMVGIAVSLTRILRFVRTVIAEIYNARALQRSNACAAAMAKRTTTNASRRAARKSAFNAQANVRANGA